jgi:hypothetical protein
VRQRCDRVRAGRVVERPPNQVDAAALECGSMRVIPPSARSATRRSRPTPSGTDLPLAVFRIEGPDVDVLDTVLAVDVVQRRPLAERDAEDATAYTLQKGTPREAGGTVLASELRQRQDRCQ